MTEQTEKTVSINQLAEMKNLLEQIRDEAAEQNKAVKKQLLYTQIFTIICAVMLVVIIITIAVIMPKLNGVLSDLQTVSNALAKADIPHMLENINSLVTKSEQGVTDAFKGVEDALKVVQSIDITTLNNAIADLKKVVEPLAKLFSR